MKRWLILLEIQPYCKTARILCSGDTDTEPYFSFNKHETLG